MIWIKDKLNELKSSDYVQNVATLATGTTIAQLISVGSAPVLYRIYSKEDYGTLGTYMAIVSVIGVFSTLRYNEAIILEKDDKDAKIVLWLNRYINIIFTFICVIGVYIINGWICTLLNNDQLRVWLYFMPISIFFGGQNEIFKIWANRKKEYRILTINAVLMALIVPFVSICIGVFNSGPIGLFLGLLIGQVTPAIILHFSLSRKYNLKKTSEINYETIKRFANRHRDFPFYSLPSDFINRLTQQLPIFMLSTLFGASIVGVYNLCTRMLAIPMQLISSSVASIFRERATYDFNTYGNSFSIFRKTTITLLLISIIPFTILIFSAPFLFELFFGQKWRMAGEFAQILTPMFFFNFIVSPLTYMYYIVNKQKEDFIGHLILLVTTFIIFYFIGNSNNVNSLLLYFSLSYCVFYIIYYFRSLQFSNGLVRTSKRL